MPALQMHFSYSSLAPTGHAYYYNAVTRESTYARPPHASHSVLPNQPRKTSQEKPLFKAHIPTTDWLRVKTTEGNVFYSHKARKESVWTVPDEIKDALGQLELDERRKEESRTKKGHMDKSEQGTGNGETAKRKAEEPIPVDEVVITKKSRTDVDFSDDEDEEDTSEDEEDENWQLVAADQLAKEADEQRHIGEAEDSRSKEDQVTESNQQAQSEQHKQSIVPAKVDLSIEEAKALFKVSLPLLCPHISSSSIHRHS